jgi:hypothetical protein
MEPKTKKWTIEYLEEDKIVVGKNLEGLNWEETKENARLLVAAMRQHNTNRLLIEHSGDIKLSVLEIDDLPTFIRGLDTHKKDRVAIFYDINSAYKSLLDFLKNVLLLTSHKLQLFTDKNKAIAWLKSEE